MDLYGANLTNLLCSRSGYVPWSGAATAPPAQFQDRATKGASQRVEVPHDGNQKHAGDSSRSRVEGDTRSDPYKAQHHLSNLTARVSKEFPKALRLSGPKRATGFDLVTSVDVT